MTPGSLVTEDWQFLIVLVVGIVVVAILHRIARRQAGRKKNPRK